MSQIAKLTCTLSALAILVSCGGGANRSTSLPALSISSTSLPDGMVAFNYAQSIQATGGIAPFAWSVSSGSLPNNVSLGIGFDQYREHLRYTGHRTNCDFHNSGKGLEGSDGGTDIHSQYQQHRHSATAAYSWTSPWRNDRDPGRERRTVQSIIVATGHPELGTRCAHADVRCPINGPVPEHLCSLAA